MTNQETNNIRKTQDALVEMAKDLLMLDIQPLLDGLDADRKGMDGVVPVRFASHEKTEAFRALVAAFKATQWAAEGFRKAHVEEEGKILRANMESQFQDRLREIESGEGLSHEDIERRRAS